MTSDGIFVYFDGLRVVPQPNQLGEGHFNNWPREAGVQYCQYFFFSLWPSVRSSLHIKIKIKIKIKIQNLVWVLIETPPKIILLLSPLHCFCIQHSPPPSLCNPGNRADPWNCTQGGSSGKVRNWKLLETVMSGESGFFLSTLYWCSETYKLIQSIWPNWRMIMR